jgi:MinD superfamily P-loop ATPase
VLVVTEPTLSAIHDLERILGVATHFRIPAVVCINKCDINKDNTKNIESYCKRNNIAVVGKLPYDIIVTEAMIDEKTVIEYLSGDFSNKINEMWNNIFGRLKA